MEEARARGDEAITFDVERIYREVQLSTEGGYMVCCDILDSERFARAHRLWYHHRTGVWGTEEATYTFLLNMSGYRGAAQRQRPGGRSLFQLVLLALIAIAVVGTAGATIMLLIG